MSDLHWREPNLFDAAEARRRRDQGVAAVLSYPADEWGEEARKFAIAYARENGTVTSDDVHQYRPMPPGIHRNAMGAVFSKVKELVPVGMMASNRVESHARRILIYKSKS